MEINIFDERIKESNWIAKEIIRKAIVVTFETDQIYLDTGYILHFPLKKLVELYAISKLASKTANKKLSKEEVKCIDVRNDKILFSGLIIDFMVEPPMKLHNEIKSYIYLDSGYRISMSCSEKDIREIENIENN